MHLVCKNDTFPSFLLLSNLQKQILCLFLIIHPIHSIIKITENRAIGWCQNKKKKKISTKSRRMNRKKPIMNSETKPQKKNIVILKEKKN
jgi:hypothetical protein